MDIGSSPIQKFSKDYQSGALSFEIISKGKKLINNSGYFADKNNKKDFDKAAEDIRLATRHLGMIVGKVDVEQISGSIFNDFCIGK